MSLRSIFTSLLLILACFSGAARGDSFEKALIPGDVIQGHAKYELECKNCHELLDKSAQVRLCNDCHKDIAADISSKSRMHGRLEEKSCRNCHTEHKGRNAKIAVIDKSQFDHGRTNFQLKGAHAETRVKCDSCHATKIKYRNAPKLCNDCHKKIDLDKGHKGKLGTKCESCHNEKNWKEAKFDHEKTKFSLLGGKHAEVKCNECHTDKTYQQTPLTCNGCHKKIDQEKGHKGNYGTKCESCHNDKGWKELRFNHDTDTHYALHGKHIQVKCNSCHMPEKGPLYKQKLSDKCIACHKKDEQEKGHRGGLGEKCASCHNERTWKTTNFNHDETKFILHDKHKEAKCDTCHKGGVSGPNAKLKVPKDCATCHRKEDDDKGHKGRYGNKCESCHNEKNWKTILFNHDLDTKYKLKDKHQQTKCDTCHLPEKGALYQKQKLTTQCAACHHKVDDEKGHKGRYGNKCESCHNEKSWKTLLFDHDRDTKYKLKHKHIQTKCDTCHLPEKGALYQPQKLDSQCISCHRKDDKHRDQLGKKCESCHNEKRWQDSPYDHNKSRFALTGSHARTECKKCHQTPAFHDAPSACNACHQKEDKHKRRYGTKCESCHYTGTWKTWDFDHGTTRFVLDGGHAKIECDDCHKVSSGNPAKLGRACISCHMKDDVHDGAFSGQCERCHVADSWKKVRK